MSANQAPVRRFFSVIVGDGCNARCAFCIAPDLVQGAAEPFPLERALEAATDAAAAGATVASVSGGGEPLMLAVKDPTTFNALTAGLADLFTKVDLHSNYAVPVGIRNADLYPGYTDLTVSLWPNPATNRTYLGTSTFDRTVATLRAEHAQGTPRRLRLSATLGTDWVRDLGDIHDYVQFAKTVGATAVTLRPLVTPPSATQEKTDWINQRRLDGAVVSQWLHQASTPVRNKTVRDADVFDIDGVAVCVYRYAIEDNELDNDFWYFRPATATGLYNTFTDYHQDITDVGAPTLATPADTVTAA